MQPGPGFVTCKYSPSMTSFAKGMGCLYVGVVSSTA